ncbi:MAG: class I SAM-dependent methyltransferase [Phycisphaerales bacterium]|nr:class I SAM-dependent methyltransferase [Phycisphaerales bacterium]
MTVHATSDTVRIAGCRSCGAAGLQQVLDLGRTPLADRLLTATDLDEPEPRFPLVLVFCPSCALVQIDETVAPEVLFGDDYPYFSSFSDALLRHSAENVAELAAARGLGSGSTVVEIASNDGYLLRNYVARGIGVLGIDPASGPAAAAEAVGVPTRVAFFGARLATELRGEGIRADVIHANNVLAHVADTNGFVAGLHTLLAEDGVAVLEVPYLRDLIEHNEFDTIYHEHLCYFGVTSLDALFRRHGLHLNDARRLAIHGGSLRLFVERRERARPAVDDLLDAERSVGMDRFSYYAGFAARVRDTMAELRELLVRLAAGGARIAAYGASAKGATLLNSSGIDPRLIEFVVDRNVHKQGRWMPGVHLPIAAPQRLLDDQPSHALLLTWNFKAEILAQQAEYIRRGGRFIVPIPRPEVV